MTHSEEWLGSLRLSYPTVLCTQYCSYHIELFNHEIAEIKDGDDAYKAWAKEHAAEFGDDALKAELAAKAEKRNADLLRALRQQSGVTEANVKVVTAPAGALARHKGKAMYKVTLEME